LATGNEDPERFIQWGTTTNVYTDECSAGIGAIGLYSCNLTNLTPNTIYYVRAKATNSAGTSYGTQTAFQTFSEGEGSATTSTLITSPVTSILPYSVTGNASITNTGGDSPQRFIQWGAASGTYPNDCSAGIGTIGAYSCQLTNLTPNTTYYVRAKATNSAGTSFGEELTFQTLSDFLEIPDPDETKVTNAINQGYLSLGTGSINDTDQTTANVGIRMTRTSVYGVSSVTLPASTVITAESENIDASKLNITDVTDNVRGIEGYPNSRGAVKIGIEGKNLTFTNPITISINVGEAYNDAVMNVFYKNDVGDDQWHSQTTCIITDNKCSFQTTHATTYTVNTDGTMVGQTGINLNTDIQEVISLNCGGTTVNLSNITPGTPVTGSSTCTTTTNANGGYSLSVRRDNATETLQKDSQPSTTIPDKTPWDPTANANSGNADTWSGTGLGFTIYDSTATKNNTWWGTGTTLTDANNKYAGFAASQSNIMIHNSYAETSTATSIGYKLDVPPTQKSGAYSGNITYQAVTAP
jgi:hypothetical protein